ncbi:unnamed protein product [Spirodela intermedia]|uniref:Branchpoint-bridging protein n=1 Tax=Spirodela intermedia TaxID=51605 RepID=A0A7I8JXF1_SPIIN|nr:unnamed protein product [Spirodela intermedia]
MEKSGRRRQEDLLYSKKKKLKQAPPPPSSKSHPQNPSGTRGEREIASEGQEECGGSGKRKQGKWDAAHFDEKCGANDDAPATKRRKTIWTEDESRFKLLGPVQLPDLLEGSGAASDNDPEFQQLNQRLMDINRRLRSRSRSQDFVHRRQEEESPPPGPTNSRERRIRARLIEQKQEIMEELIGRNPTFDHPSDCKPRKKLFKKLYLPAKKYPYYNFVGLIIGPRGRTQKRMERETGARIQLRGRGCQRKDTRPDPSGGEDPHVLVEADSQRSLDAAAALVERLLLPVAEGKNSLKRSQLRELAELKKRPRGDGAHRAPPSLSESKADEVTGRRDRCGGGGPGRGLSPEATSTEPPPCGGDDDFFRKVERGDVRVDRLPQSVDVGRLVPFSPLGSLTYTQLVREDGAGAGRGCCGFVSYNDPASAAEAVRQMNGYRTDEKRLLVGEASDVRRVAPPVIGFLPACPDSALTSWPGVAGASSHMVFESAAPRGASPSASVVALPEHLLLGLAAASGVSLFS